MIKEFIKGKYYILISFGDFNFNWGFRERNMHPKNLLNTVWFVQQNGYLYNKEHNLTGIFQIHDFNNFKLKSIDYNQYWAKLNEN